MQHHRHNGRQAPLFAPRIRLMRPARQAVRAALAELIAALLRPPARARRQGGPNDGPR
jgi:hypothetical protein